MTEPRVNPDLAPIFRTLSPTTAAAVPLTDNTSDVESFVILNIMFAAMSAFIFAIPQSTDVAFGGDISRIPIIDSPITLSLPHVQQQQVLGSPNCGCAVLSFLVSVASVSSYNTCLFVRSTVVPSANVPNQ